MSILLLISAHVSFLVLPLPGWSLRARFAAWHFDVDEAVYFVLVIIHKMHELFNLTVFVQRALAGVDSPTTLPKSEIGMIRQQILLTCLPPLSASGSTPFIPFSFFGLIRAEPPLIIIIFLLTLFI